ncbi:MAG TPA: VOC family protein [Baekduia sp.]|nr:VOC family protein [Baekduia sp.]
MQFRGEVAHLGHVELLTPAPDESLRFFEDLLGMEVVAREGESVFLRGFGDYERYCLKLTASETSGLGHLAVRASSQEALLRRVAELERSGLGVGWHDGDVGHGPAYRFRDPDGRLFEIYYETERYVPPEHLRPPMANQYQRRTGRGVGVRRLEHANFVSPDVRACREHLEQRLGYRCWEIIKLDDQREWGAWLSATVQGHEIIYIQERLPLRGRLHHIAFWVDTREEVLRAADLFQDDGIFIEAGPAKHTPIHSFYLYVYEPGGNRIEVTSGGYLVFDPDPEVLTAWTMDQYRGSRAWGGGFPPTFDYYATPPASEEMLAAAGVV